MGKRRIAKIILVILLLAAICGSLLGCKQEKNELDSLDDFQHARIGLLTGSSFAEMSKKTFPEAECKYYMLITDMILSYHDELSGGQKQRAASMRMGLLSRFLSTRRKN